MNSFLESHALFKTYGSRTVVKGVGVRVDQGEIVGLLGPNGAGKTTTFYMMVGLVRPDKGSIVLSGDDISKEPLHVRALKGIGYLPQEASIFRDLTVEANIFAVLENRDLPRAKQVTLLNSLI